MRNIGDGMQPIVEKAIELTGVLDIANAAIDTYVDANNGNISASNVTGTVVGVGADLALKKVKVLREAVETITKNADGIIQHTKHSLNQKINRQIKSSDELDAIRNPLDVRPVKLDSQGRPSQRIIGAKAEIVINPKTGVVVSINPTSSKKAARLKRKLERQE